MRKISLLCLLLLCLVMTGCGKETKEAKTLTDFESVCVNSGFSVSDNMEEYENIDYVSAAKIATLDSITMQMVVYDSNENAEKVLNEHISVFMTMKGSGSVINKNKGNNYYHFDMISNGYYMVSSRIDNTLIFTKTLLKNKDMVSGILDNLDY